jgi:hypothetical protein
LIGSLGIGGGNFAGLTGGFSFPAHAEWVKASPNYVFENPERPLAVIHFPLKIQNPRETHP